VGYTFYADRFDTDDVVLRLAMLTAMLAVAWLAVEIPGVFESPRGAARFAAAYATVRLVLIGLYLRADHHEPQARPLTRRYIAGFTAGAMLWLASVWVAAPGRYLLWAIGILVELTPPLLSSAAFRRVPSTSPTSPSASPRSPSSRSARPSCWSRPAWARNIWEPRVHYPRCSAS
jgi:low temperature requirement protein LtrA